ncbi:MAG TPA: YfhO family protein [Flavisolibacter sp.]
MKKGILQRLLPHLVALLIFLAIAVIYCSPALEGKVIGQHDITQWKGSFQQSEVYKEKHGEYPLWTNALFSGMPAFQIGGIGGNHLGSYWHVIMTLGLPKPIAFFFLACACFYILCMVLRIRPYIAILGSLAFAYATYNPVIISVGHDTKMFSIAYMPAVVGSFILLYEGRYWLGGALAALFTSAIVAMNHLQIVYYTFLVIGVMTVFYLVHWIRSREFRFAGIAAGIALAALAIGVLTNAIMLLSTYEYQKETIRGGYSELSGSTQKGDVKGGLKKDYAFEYSMGIAEPFVMMVPRMYGGHSDAIENLREESKALEALQSMPQELANQLAANRISYWGWLGGVGTSGPPYAGAIICFLAIIALFLPGVRHKWWAVTAIVLAIMMSWGHYFESFNGLLYKYLPFYNKFRAPSMILVIPQLLLPMLAVLGLERIAMTEDRRTLFPSFKKGLLATAGVFVLLLLLYISLDFISEADQQTLNQVKQMNQPQLTEMVNNFYDGLAADRKALMLGDIFRSLGFILVAALGLFLLVRNVLKPLPVMLGIALFAFIDVMAIDVKYLNKDKYEEPADNMASFQKTQVDEQILADTSYFRVFNVSSANDNTPSYYYNSITGYHPAKLRIYQDLIEKQIYRQPWNEAVLDMLNTKYLIQKDQSRLTQAFQPRPTALGPVWFVKGIRFVKNADEEMAALDHFTPKDTAIVQEQYKQFIPFMPQPDSAAVIRLLKNDNDVVTYQSQAPTNQFAVFSEVYYNRGWKAFVDGKEMPIVKVNYVLRGLALPAGNHQIEFRFEPEGYMKGKSLRTVFSVALLLLIAGALYAEWRRANTVKK